MSVPMYYAAGGVCILDQDLVAQPTWAVFQAG